MIVRRMLALLLSAALVGGLAPGAALPAHATEPNDGAAAQSAAIELTASDVNPGLPSLPERGNRRQGIDARLVLLGRHPCKRRGNYVRERPPSRILRLARAGRGRAGARPVPNPELLGVRQPGSRESSVLPYYPTAQLSRAHLAWFTYRQRGAGSGGCEELPPTGLRHRCLGPAGPSARWAAWKGPVLSSRVPFQAAYVDESLRYAADFHLQDAYYLPTSLNGITGAAMKPSIDTVKTHHPRRGPRHGIHRHTRQSLARHRIR